jgi:hypothetical protein
MYWPAKESKTQLFFWPFASFVPQLVSVDDEQGCVHHPLGQVAAASVQSMSVVQGSPMAPPVPAQMSPRELPVMGWQ